MFATDHLTVDRTPSIIDSSSAEQRDDESALTLARHNWLSLLGRSEFVLNNGMDKHTRFLMETFLTGKASGFRSSPPPVPFAPPLAPYLSKCCAMITTTTLPRVAFRFNNRERSASDDQLSIGKNTAAVLFTCWMLISYIFSASENFVNQLETETSRSSSTLFAAGDWFRRV